MQFPRRELPPPHTGSQTQVLDPEAGQTYVCEYEKNGTICLSSFKTKRARDIHLRVVHGMVSRTGSAVVTNECPCCRTTFRAKFTAQRHARKAFENGTCFADLTQKPHPIIVPDSLESPFCEQQPDDLDTLQRHIVVQHAHPSTSISPASSLAVTDDVSVTTGLA